MSLDNQINESIKPLSTTQKANVLNLIYKFQEEVHPRNSQNFRRQAIHQIQAALTKGYAF